MRNMCFLGEKPRNFLQRSLANYEGESPIIVEIKEIERKIERRKISCC